MIGIWGIYYDEGFESHIIKKNFQFVKCDVICHTNMNQKETSKGKFVYANFKNFIKQCIKQSFSAESLCIITVW